MTSVAQRFFCYCLIALSTSLNVSSLDAQAQFGGQPKRDPITGSSGKSLAPAPDELKEKISLPDIPEYTGQPKFVNGFTYHVPKQGPSYVMTFNVKEDPKTVIDWWKNTLKMYRWKIIDAGKDAVTASNKDGSMCVIQVSGPVFTTDEKSFRASYQIRYLQKERQ